MCWFFDEKHRSVHISEMEDDKGRIMHAWLRPSLFTAFVREGTKTKTKITYILKKCWHLTEKILCAHVSAQDHERRFLAFNCSRC